MKNVYEGVTEEHIAILKNYYKTHYFINKWTSGLSTLYTIFMSFNLYINISKEYYFGIFSNPDECNPSIHNKYLELTVPDTTILEDSYSFNRLTNSIDEVLNLNFYTDTPIFYIYEYNKEKTSCRYNIFDLFSLTYVSFLIELKDLPEDTSNLHCLLKEEAASLLKQQLFNESDLPVINYLTKQYGFTFDKTPLTELYFDFNL